MRHAPEAPGRVWVPSAEDDRIASSDKAPSVPLERPGPEPLDLPELVEIALANNPKTQVVWNQARVEAARYAKARSAYYPNLEGGADIEYGVDRLIQFTPELQQQSYGPFGTLSFLLFDFGGRRATVESARLALLSSNWQHNEAIQNVVFGTMRAYYLHIAAGAALDAARASLRDAGVFQDAARERFRFGAGIRAEVLQADAQVSEARLDVTRRAGDVEITRGVLATALGLPADTPVEVRATVRELPLSDTDVRVQDLIQRATEEHPSLQAARAKVAARRQDVIEARSAALPRFDLDAYASERFFIGECVECLDFFAKGDRSYSGPAAAYGVSVSVSAPIFDGFERWNEIRETKAAVDLAESRIEAAERAVAEEVWTAYYRLRAARERTEAAIEFVESASASYRVNLESFKMGSTEAVDVASTREALARARMEQVEARADLRISLAALLRATGRLETIPSS